MKTELKLVRIGKAAKALGVSVSSLRRWHDKGYIPRHITPAGHRRFDIDEVKLYLKPPETRDEGITFKG